MMHTVGAFAVLSLSLLASQATATDYAPFQEAAVKIQAAAVEMNGEYTMYNPKTGKYASFERKQNNAMSIILTDDKRTIHLDTVTSKGDSGTDKSTTGVVISDGDTVAGKCASAAWNFDGNLVAKRGVEKRAYDEFFIPYACALGTYQSRSADTIVDAKQMWQIVECPSSSSSASAVKFNAASTSSKSTNAKFTAANKASDESDSDSDSDSGSDSKDDSSSCQKPNDWICRHPQYVEGHSECQSLLDRCADITAAAKCPKAADWICRHPSYVRQHPECKSALSQCSSARFVKRSHAALAAKLRRKRELVDESDLVISGEETLFEEELYGDDTEDQEQEEPVTFEKRGLERRDSSTHCVIASDHLDNQETRAASASGTYAFQDVYGLTLAVYDKTDAAQQWVFTQV